MEQENQPKDEKVRGEEVAKDPEARSLPEQNENVGANKESDEGGNAQQPGNNDDLVQKKVICAISYLFGILFFLPLAVYPNDDFAKFHANQSLVILLTAVIGGVVFGILSIIPVVGIVFTVLVYVFEVLILVLCILGIVSAAKLEKKELPVLGKIKIIK